MMAGALGKPRSLKPVSYFTLKTLARLDAVSGVFTRKRRITVEHARAAFHQAKFSNRKFMEATGFEFTPVEEVIRQVAGFYRKDHPQHKIAAKPR